MTSKEINTNFNDFYFLMPIHLFECFWLPAHTRRHGLTTPPLPKAELVLESANNILVTVGVGLGKPLATKGLWYGLGC